MSHVANVPSGRVRLSPSVAALLAQETPQALLGRSFVRFAEALMDPNGDLIDDVVTPDARFHELEAIGLPPGPAGFKAFRKQMNEALPDEQALVVEMRFPEPNIIETELACTATHRGEMMGVPATGRSLRFTVHTRNRFEGGRMAERWDHMDVADLLAQLKE